MGGLWDCGINTRHFHKRTPKSSPSKGYKFKVDGKISQGPCTHGQYQCQHTTENKASRNSFSENVLKQCEWCVQDFEGCKSQKIPF